MRTIGETTFATAGERLLKDGDGLEHGIGDAGVGHEVGLRREIRRRRRLGRFGVEVLGRFGLLEILGDRDGARDDGGGRGGEGEQREDGEHHQREGARLRGEAAEFAQRELVLPRRAGQRESVAEGVETGGQAVFAEAFLQTGEAGVGRGFGRGVHGGLLSSGLHELYERRDPKN